MPESESPEQLPSVDALQFRRAEPANAEEKSCVACKQPIAGEHYQVNNQVICPSCAARIQAGQQSQKHVPLTRAVLYGLGAAVAGCILYAIPLAIGFQIGIVALAVGWMVGKAIRNGSYGTGGRAQQILAVVLTYVAISTSFIPALVFTGLSRGMKQGIEERSAAKKQAPAPQVVQPVTPKVSVGGLVAGLLVLAAISPFLELRASPVGGLISLFIIFIGLQRAWALTARHEIIVTGPYS